jgi:hypothetical protein
MYPAGPENMFQHEAITIYIIIVEDSVIAYVEPNSGTNAKNITIMATIMY